MAFTDEDTGGGAAESVGGAGDEDAGHVMILPPTGCRYSASPANHLDQARIARPPGPTALAAAVGDRPGAADGGAGPDGAEYRAAVGAAGLSLLTATFTELKERNKAFGIYGAIVGTGGAIGLLLGGALTQYLSWRWTLHVNLIFAGVASKRGATQASPSTNARLPESVPFPYSNSGGRSRRGHTAGLRDRRSCRS